jgi:ATP-dependent DNA helicase RecQ
VTKQGWLALKGEESPKLLKPVKKAAKKKRISKIAKDSWEGVDENLFDTLRQARREIADKKGVPAYLVFSDAALRDMARKKPRTDDEFLEVSGVGAKKLKQYGETFLEIINR